MGNGKILTKFYRLVKFDTDWGTFPTGTGKTVPFFYTSRIFYNFFAILTVFFEISNARNTLLVKTLKKIAKKL